MESKFTGAITALVTPFRDGAVDETALAALIDWQIESGIDGLVPCGTTGESPTLNHVEHNHVVEFTVKRVAGRVPVIAGTGSNSTNEAIGMTRHARDCGADAALIVTPYYNKPTQAGLLAHFTAIHEAVPDLPQFIYNIPGRSVIDMEVETMGALAQLANIIGVKDATADLARVAAQKAACGEDFIQISGEDATALAFNQAGGFGCISVAANIAPALCAQLQAASLAGDIAAAEAIDKKLQGLFAALFCETSPGPAKYALARMGKMSGELRLPMVDISAAAKAQVDAALDALGL